MSKNNKKQPCSSLISGNEAYDNLFAKLRKLSDIKGSGVEEIFEHGYKVTRASGREVIMQPAADMDPDAINAVLQDYTKLISQIDNRHAFFSISRSDSPAEAGQGYRFESESEDDLFYC